MCFLANAFLGSAEQEGAKASAAPPGCLEIPILCLRLAFGIGVTRRLEGAAGSAGPLRPALGSATGLVPSSPSRAWCRGRAEEEPGLFTHPILGEKELFQTTATEQ